MKKEKKCFCTNCRKETEYIVCKKEIVKSIREKEYTFDITVAECKDCGEEVSVHGLIDYNIQEIDKQYRKAEKIITIDDIQKLMTIYNIGKAPLSLALGFGEITITRYLEGQVPSKEYSDVIRLAMSSPDYMKKKLRENKDSISDSAYRKAIDAANDIESLFSVSSKMLCAIARVFDKLEEVTPLMLQKLLYFSEGINYALNGRTMFSEECRAWAHGPVYPEVYNLFRSFRYNPIDDPRFLLLDGLENELSEKEVKVLDSVLETFGMYGGKTLERITHNEEPWENVRIEYFDGEPSNELMSKKRIRDYYIKINEHYDLRTESGINKYIKDMLRKR